MTKQLPVVGSVWRGNNGEVRKVLAVGKIGPVSRCNYVRYRTNDKYQTYRTDFATTWREWVADNDAVQVTE